MPETQAREWKRSWRDEHLKWICGFANARGGVLEIGKDDGGQIVGVENPLRLVEEFPNKALALSIPTPIRSATRAGITIGRAARSRFSEARRSTGSFSESTAATGTTRQCRASA